MYTYYKIKVGFLSHNFVEWIASLIVMCIVTFTFIVDL